MPVNDGLGNGFEISSLVNSQQPQMLCNKFENALTVEHITVFFWYLLLDLLSIRL